ncbi:hypothetical protein ACOQFL_16065 [Actinopolyspora sp. H202]|uniref:hypothetical protein n=1 Tax=Actinopolyspora sp. H202 TaxID=1500456 RepID=UPI003EE4D654
MSEQPEKTDTAAASTSQETTQWMVLLIVTLRIYMLGLDIALVPSYNFAPSLPKLRSSAVAPPRRSRVRRRFPAR